MRAMLLATATVAALCVGGTAIAQTADSGPMSTQATHINKADTGSTISPRLPAPAVGDEGPDQFLQSAKRDVSAGRTGAAQEALERAETRLLDRSTDPSAANQPDASPRVEHVRNALRMLAGRDRSGAVREIDAAMGDNAAPMAGGSAPMAPMTPMAPMGSPNPINTPISPGGSSGVTPTTATGGNATGTGAPTAVGGTGSGGGAATSGGTVTP